MKRNRKRQARLYALQVAGPISGYDHAEAVRKMPCCVTGEPGPSHPHHVKTRGAGGKWSDMVPLSSKMHHAVHTLGRHTFEANYSVDLAAIAAELAGAVLANRSGESKGSC